MRALRVGECARKCAQVSEYGRVYVSVRVCLRVSCILTVSNAADEHQQKDSTPEIHDWQLEKDKTK